MKKLIFVPDNSVKNYESMKKQIFSLPRQLIFVILFLLPVGCNEFFLEDIEEKKVDIIAPSDGTVTEIVTNTFSWAEVDGASQYRLQIVTPSFDKAEALVTDTTIEETMYEETLYAGEFEYRVRAENSGYKTDWSVAGFTIISSDDLTRQTIKLRKPVEGLFTNLDEIGFKWDTLSFADTYELSLYEDDWGQTLIADSVNIKKGEITVPVQDEGKFWWGVKAINQKSESLFSKSYFIIDRTPPKTPTLDSPKDGDTLSEETINFSWTSSDPPWETVQDSLFVFEVVSNTKKKLVHKGKYSNKSASVELEKGKEYSWYVKSVDQAWNESAESDALSFVLN
jgi:hypothetical protein